MAIKISNTTVIDNSRVMQALTGISGKYNELFPTVTTGTNVVDMNDPVTTYTMTGNATISFTNGAAGKSALLLLDRSSSGHTPTFGSGFRWPGAVTPTWSSYRYWMISIVAVSSTTVRASAEGYGGTTPVETITLTGTSGSPTYVGNIVVSDNDYARSGLFFTVGGTIQYASGLGGQSTTNLASWCNVSPSQTYYIRCLNTAGDPPDDAGNLMNTWYALSTQRNFIRIDTRSTPSYGNESITARIEIASDAAGSNILATGYYQWEWTGLA